MTWALLNGIRLPVAPGGWSEDDDSLETDTRMITGRMHRDLIGGRRRQWKVETPIMLLEDALAWRALLQGEGYLWGPRVELTYYYSDKGLLYSSSGASGSSSGGKYDDRLTISNPVSATLETWEAWTVATWARPGSSWIHRAQTSEGDQYQDGEAWPSSWSLTAGGGSLSISSDHGEICETLALPAVMPASWMNDLAVAEREMAPRPYCRLSGECISQDYADVLGCEVRLRHVHLGDGVRRAVLTATLRED